MTRCPFVALGMEKRRKSSARLAGIAIRDLDHSHEARYTKSGSGHTLMHAMTCCIRDIYNMSVRRTFCETLEIDSLYLLLISLNSISYESFNVHIAAIQN